jgi:hypothetical protein
VIANWPRCAGDADAVGEADDGGPLRVIDAHLSAALDQLLDTRNQLTRVLLGAQQEPRRQ